MSHPLVSVIIPIYNAERYLADTLRSVFAQTFQDYEVICVNDGSTDGSARVLNQFAGKVRIISQSNSGQTVAQNRGVQESGGRLLAFLDSDDIWYPHKLAAQVEVMQASSQAVMVNSNFDWIDPAGTVLRRGVALASRRDAIEKKDPLMQLLNLPVEIPSFMLIRREAFEKVGGWDPMLPVWDMDYDLCVRLRDLGEFRFIETSGGAKRVHPLSHTHGGQFRRRRLQCSVRFMEKVQARYANDPAKSELARRILADRYSDMGWHEAKFGDWSEGFYFLKYACKLNPWNFRSYSRLLRAIGIRSLRGFAIN